MSIVKVSTPGVLAGMGLMSDRERSGGDFRWSEDGQVEEGAAGMLAGWVDEAVHGVLDGEDLCGEGDQEGIVGFAALVSPPDEVGDDRADDTADGDERRAGRADESRIHTSCPPHRGQ
ncbi:hypothetical protein [Arthrobacter crusticola]|uniref:hypothetical protein n=1 Tax=Arthrobacter crusticola TaxID=2547960 RepID=UPI001404E312|nr:hypothetical protein [Arthrobacter crusticola]